MLPYEPADGRYRSACERGLGHDVVALADRLGDRRDPAARRDDRQRAVDLATVRLFPEAKDFVSPADDLLVGTGGSLYSVTDDEITHLCFTV